MVTSILNNLVISSQIRSINNDSPPADTGQVRCSGGYILADPDIPSHKMGVGNKTGGGLGHISSKKSVGIISSFFSLKIAEHCILNALSRSDRMASWQARNSHNSSVCRRAQNSRQFILPQNCVRILVDLTAFDCVGVGLQEGSYGGPGSVYSHYFLCFGGDIAPYENVIIVKHKHTKLWPTAHILGVDDGIRLLLGTHSQ